MSSMPVQMEQAARPPQPRLTGFGTGVSGGVVDYIKPTGIDPTDPTQVAIDQEYRMMLQQLLERGKRRVGFKFEVHLRRQFGFGMDPDRPICPFWANSNGTSCPYQSDCPFKHPSKIFNNKIVCKYWLRGLCKMGDDCDFLHEYNLSKMPECAYYSANGFCQQAGECIYLHVDPQSKIPECWNYTNLGFCPEGPKCPRRHVRRVMCPRYLAGFCPDGPSCALFHPKFKQGMMTQSKFKILTDEELIAKRKEALEGKEAKVDSEPKVVAA